MSSFKRFMLVANLSIVALGCYDGNDLTTDAPPKQVLPPSGYSHGDGGAPAAPAPEVEVSKQALYVNPPASPCIGEQPAFTLRLFRWTSTDPSNPCLQFPSNMEAHNMGIYNWPAPDGTNLNDNVRKAIGSVVGNLGKCQRVTLQSDWMWWGTYAMHQVCYLGTPGQGWNVWLYHPDNFNFGATGVRYEVY